MIVDSNELQKKIIIILHGRVFQAVSESNDKYRSLKQLSQCGPTINIILSQINLKSIKIWIHSIIPVHIYQKNVTTNGLMHD